MKTVYIILKNADMTEGRGPMVMTGEAFFNLKEAKECIKSKTGVMRRKTCLIYQFGQWYANDHEIKEIQVK